MATAWCAGGPADGEMIPVELDERGFPPGHLIVAVPALDESTERFWFVNIRYLRSVMFRTPREGQPWKYTHIPPTRRKPTPSAS